MNELQELLQKYQIKLDDTNNLLNSFIANFPNIDMNQEIIPQIDIKTYHFFETLIESLNFEKEEKKIIDKAFKYYLLNSDLDFTMLLFQDENYTNFLTIVKRLWSQALNYKKEMIAKYQGEKEQIENFIRIIENIKILFQSSDEINLDNLIITLKKLPLSLASKIDILKLALKHNLEIYQEIRKNFQNTQVELVKEAEAKEEEKEEKILDTKELDYDENVDYLNLIDIYLKKIDYFNTILLRDGNYQDDKYIIYSKMMEYKNILNNFQTDYQTVLKMVKDALEDELPDYQKYQQEIASQINEAIIEIDNLIDMYKIENQEELNETSKERDLIILNSVFKDLNQFDKLYCSEIITKKLYSLLQQLKHDEVIYGIPYTMLSSPYAINEIKTGRIRGGTPRVFYQLLDDKVIVLLMGIEGRSNHQIFKNTIEGRIAMNVKSEYAQLMKAYKAATSNPNDVCVYNDKQTNQEYLEELLANYQKVEEEFWNNFYSNYYNPNSKVRG